MSSVLTEPKTSAPYVTLRVSPVLELTDEQFFNLCQINRDLRLERTAEGDIIVMPPTGGETGNRNQEVNRQLGNWTRQDGSGASFDSSTGFSLPDGSDRSPDAAWISHARLSGLTAEQKKKFIPLCPDFVIELLSPSDELADVLAKMAEYIANGARLGWLIDPEERRLFVYRPGTAVEELKNITQVSGNPELPGFTLDLHEIWEPKL
ncbi:MAG TPA: Uma2 family endonuclease [Blastocatellia bacterium]|nr:Uma2 family endonuclease [Blastocatellia bacterium]